jgi:gas vesicle protein
LASLIRAGKYLGISSRLIIKDFCCIIAFMKKNVKKRVKEAMEKYNSEKEKVQNEQPFSPKPLSKQNGGFTTRPDKKRG